MSFDPIVTIDRLVARLRHDRPFADVAFAALAGSSAALYLSLLVPAVILLVMALLTLSAALTVLVVRGPR